MPARHLRYKRPLDRWVDRLALVVFLSSALLFEVRPHFVWWVTAAIALGRMVFSAVYRRKDQRERAQWKNPLDNPDDSN
jgi:hypothetical protein